MKITTENSYNYLNEKGLIFPGSIIVKKEIEAALGMEYSETWRFRGPYIELIRLIQDHWYFTTEDGLQNPEFRLLNTAEMADHAYKKIIRNMSSNSRTSHILANHDISKLDEKQQKTHTSIQLKAANIALAQQRIIFQDQSFS